MYGNYYSPQTSIERINSQIAELEKIKSQIPMQPSLTQNFQIAPTRESIRYANSIEEVQKEMTTGDTPYFSKDMSIVWIKNGKDIKTYELSEIIPKDSKDIQIELLQSEIEELKGIIKNERYYSNDDETSSTEDDEPIRETIKESKSQSIPRFYSSKKRQL